MQSYRERLRKQGLRPIQIWVPDQRSAEFKEELKAQVARLCKQDEFETMDFIAESQDWSD